MHTACNLVVLKMLAVFFRFQLLEK